MKLIQKVKGACKRPYVVYSVVGYYATYDEAVDALQQIRQSPTLTNVYEMWLPSHAKSVSTNTLNNYGSAFAHLISIHNVTMNDITYLQLQSIIDLMLSAGLSYSSCKKVRTLISQLFDYAIINGWCTTNYAKFLNLGHNKPVRPHKPFTTQAINRLWRLESPLHDIPLILLYTGMRASELLNLKARDINRKQCTIKITSSKTKSGIRTIPVHDCIWPIIERRLDSVYVIQECRTYSSLSREFNKAMKAINANHTTHDCRHTFATRLDNEGANYNAKRLLLGHASGNVTDGVYTHKSLCQLRKAIRLLK
ncbi:MULTISPECIES: site-specific integrase [unclassified Veillonella]|uniref:tyrosine-type recombinase/integrase n=1 Tax=unclassified Veillonella TaxID=2630086 RepID=UPI0013DFF3CE|nr:MULTISPECIES: site-specific integrase [unclassified Veillonella]